MTWLNLKSITAIVSAALLTGTGTYWLMQKEMNRLSDANQELSSQQEKLTAEYQGKLTEIQNRDEEIHRLQNETSELLRLRNEVSQLRRQVKSQPRQQTKVVPPPGAEKSDMDFVIQAGGVSFPNSPAGMVLIAYKELTGKQLAFTWEAQGHVSVPTVTVRNDQAMKKSEVIHLLEQALKDQVGLVMTPGDNQHVIVTYNESLRKK